MKSTSFVHYLTQRNKLTFRNIRNGEEFWHIFVSRLHLLGAALAILVITFGSVLVVVAYTPILDLVPGNPGSKSRELLLDNLVRLDSLEREVRGWEQYNANLLLILEGGTPILDASNDSTASRISKNTTLVPRSLGDSLLRLSHSGDTIYMNKNKARKRMELTFEMIPPSSGVIAKRFDPKRGEYGVVLTPPAGQVVLGVMDGTVVFNGWDPANGQIIAVQHAGNMMSIYKQAARSLKNTGERVRAGEPIAVNGEMRNGNPPQLGFELWHNGSPVDPENYIAF